jgi:hypothetical protein
MFKPLIIVRKNTANNDTERIDSTILTIVHLQR